MIDAMIDADRRGGAVVRGGYILTCFTPSGCGGWILARPGANAELSPVVSPYFRDLGGFFAFAFAFGLGLGDSSDLTGVAASLASLALSSGVSGVASGAWSGSFTLFGS
jgi:hypothetical protein